jgi:hypothetical protein
MRYLLLYDWINNGHIAMEATPELLGDLKRLQKAIQDGKALGYSEARWVFAEGKSYYYTNKRSDLKWEQLTRTLEEEYVLISEDLSDDDFKGHDRPDETIFFVHDQSPDGDSTISWMVLDEEEGTEGAMTDRFPEDSLNQIIARLEEPEGENDEREGIAEGEERS